MLRKARSPCLSRREKWPHKMRLRPLTPPCKNAMTRQKRPRKLRVLSLRASAAALVEERLAQLDVPGHANPAVDRHRFAGELPRHFAISRGGAIQQHHRPKSPNLRLFEDVRERFRLLQRDVEMLLRGFPLMCCGGGDRGGCSAEAKNWPKCYHSDLDQLAGQRVELHGLRLPPKHDQTFDHQREHPPGAAPVVLADNRQPSALPAKDSHCAIVIARISHLEKKRSFSEPANKGSRCETAGGLSVRERFLQITSKQISRPNCISKRVSAKDHRILRSDPAISRRTAISFARSGALPNSHQARMLAQSSARCD